ncbi:hypothetical protein NL108_014474, partial [Boleophthalmus pectinirostris]
ELVQNLNSTDTGIQQKAIEEADRHIAASREPCKTTFSHITINPVPPLQAPTVKTLAYFLFFFFLLLCSLFQNFMKTIEKDAEDREKKRTEKEKRATALKDRGNKAFAQEDYETAVKYYSEGLVELKDMQVLYTNRALAYMKLSKYKEAICDCEWALKCNEKCIKAYLHMGKAYQALKNYNESRKCFEKIVEFEPARKDMIKGYLLQLDLDEKRDVQENSARQDFDMRESKAIAVSQLLEKLSRSGHGLVWYCEALKCLTHTVTNSTAQTLFRLNNGFSIINDNDIVKSCLLKGYTDPLSQELCVTVLKLWQTICSENDENQKTLMACPVFRKSIAEYLLSDDGAVQKECLSLLLLYSQTPRGRQLAVDNLDVQMLAKNLMACFSKPGQQQEDTAVNILENFASENRFCCLLRPGLVEAVMTPFTTILVSSVYNAYRQYCTFHIILYRYVCYSVCARRQVTLKNPLFQTNINKSHQPKEYTAFEYKGILYPLLGLMINLSAHPSPAVQELAVSICDSCLGMLTDSDGEVVMRATGVLSHVLLQSSEAVQCAVQRGVVRNMLLILKGTGQTATKYAIRTLTVCTAANQLAREELVKADK